ncbi:predicted protein [Plenodomus lingam JN3]|uniref:Predicted protein n=1 Tax=Leptosphaeria maculans (strain JN3 / isolate v23.1.3 / race Av1-4-5-6-7-8) TaxID=985895 RepID=E4ZJE8_LEPMJ|nr:predicted protein [Plenodomus lingam JN3]CBX91579.1 predicted protein [Plenodomus lingam JN3]
MRLKSLPNSRYIVGNEEDTCMPSTPSTSWPFTISLSRSSTGNRAATVQTTSEATRFRRA